MKREKTASHLTRIVLDVKGYMRKGRLMDCVTDDILVDKKSSEYVEKYLLRGVEMTADQGRVE